jgi:recyclin-1
MGCWNEAEARLRFEEGMRRRYEAQRRKQGAAGGLDGNVDNPADTVPESANVTLFDVSLEEERRRQVGEKATAAGTLSDGFESLSISASPTPSASLPTSEASARTVNVLGTIKSIRGSARQQYGRIYKALAPFYFDIAQSKTHTEAVLFRTFRDPQEQAVMLAQLQRFARSDQTQGCRFREERLASTMGVFESAVLHEFEKYVE